MCHRPRRAYTLFQLLIVLAVLLLLAGMLLPSVLQVRDLAARTQSTNNLKQIGLGVISLADANMGNLPPGVDDNRFSAAAHILPYIEQDPLYKKITLTRGMDDKVNADARGTRIKIYESPRDPIEQVNQKWGATNYLYNDKIFYLNSKSLFPASFPDGTSNSILTGETLKGDGSTKATDVQRQHVLLAKDKLKGLTADGGSDSWKDDKNIVGDRCASWMDGRFLQGTFNGALKLNDSRPDVSCAGVGGVSTLRSLNNIILVGLADGSVRSLNARTLTFQTWTFALDPADGNVLGPDW